MRAKHTLLIIIFVIFTITVSGYTAVFDSNEKLTLDLEKVELPMVLNMIAQQYNLNIVLSADVSGEITLRLHEVDIKTALEAILYPNGYNYYVKDDIIIVKTEEDNAFDELESIVIRLEYLDPAAAVKALTSMKSDKGTIVILDKQSEGYSNANAEKYAPNRIFITDHPIIIEKMKTLVAEMDVEEKLISIKVRIIETKLDSQSNLGFNWPTALTASLKNTTTSTSTSSSSSSTSTGTDEKFALSKNLNQGGWSWGTLSVGELQTVLNLLEQEGNSKLLSDPYLNTLENHEAEIGIETVIPIQTINRFTEAAATQDIVTFYDEEVGISLVVTPRINSVGKITLDVAPKIEDIIGFSGTEGSQKPITISRTVKTRITVGDGETAVLGGLYKDDVIETTKRVPFLGHIPVLGKLLFSSKSKETETTDLIIMITPLIVK